MKPDSAALEADASSKSYWIVKVYPFVLLALAVGLNFAFGMAPAQVSLPSKELIGLIACAAIILVINHSWIMTATELARNRFQIFASPEEWASSGRSKSDVSERGAFEVERCLNTHRNTTENVVYYILLLAAFSFMSPGHVAAWVWILMFPVARLGYTYSYFAGKDGVRGIFMSLTLLSVYGMAVYSAVGVMLLQGR